MAFDIKTARPVDDQEASGFDLSTARPVGDVEAEKYLQRKASEVGPLESLGISAGRGFMTAGRGVERLTGIDIPGVEPEGISERKAVELLRKERPYTTFAGEVAGESAPFLIGGIAGAPKTLLPRLAAAFGLGATEGTVISAGQGREAGEVAATGVLAGTFASAADLAMPVFGRILGKTIRKLTGKKAPPLRPNGTVPDEVKRVLEDAGISEDDLVDESIAVLKDAASSPEGLDRLRAGLSAGETPEMAARASLFDDLGIPTTRSRIEQTPEAFLEERTLARQVDDPLATGLRERLAAESAGFRDVAQKLADDLGFGDDAGVSIKEAISARKTGEKAKVKALYDDLKVKSNGRGIPLAGADIFDALESDDVRGFVGRLSPAEVNDLNDRLIEFGLDSDPDRVEKFIQSRLSKSGALPTKAEVTPLSVNNAEEFRQALNSLSGPDASPEMNAVVGKLKEGLDIELDALDKALQSGDLGAVGGISRDIIEASKRARAAHKQFMGEFGPDKAVSALIKKKRGSFDEPQIVASEVARRILASRGELASPEAVESIVTTLAKSGEQGAKALGDLQSATVMDMMNSALKAKSQKLDGGVIEWSGVNFRKRMEQLGPRKLKAIFDGNPQALGMLEKLLAAGDAKTGFATVMKSSGTADDLINFLNRAPGLRSALGAGGVETAILGAVAEKGASSIKKRAVRKKVKKAMNTSPVVKQQLQQYRLAYPMILTAIGIQGVNSYTENE